MKSKYEEIFKNLVSAFYNDTFEAKITELFSDVNVDKQELDLVVSTLCGTQLHYPSLEGSSSLENYIKELKEAISKYKAEGKVINKVKSCSMDCINEKGETICQASCPFDAIMIDKQKHTTYIDPDRCTDCGFCVDACPSGSIMDKVEFLPLANLLKLNYPVIVAVAPAITGQFGSNVNLNKLRTVFKKMGFMDMVEVAFFADMLTLKEAVEFNHLVSKKDDLMITSCCCPMWVAMIKNVYHDLVKYVSPSISPMIAAGRILKRLNSDCKVVFIGPCIAKKAEANDKELLGDIDFVLTFTELRDIFDALNIVPEDFKEDASSEYASRGGRLYARTGGVSIAVSEAIQKLFPSKYELLTAIQSHGIKNCKEILELVRNCKVDANFIEGMGCIGGCVGGPKAIIPKENGTLYVNHFADESIIKVATDSDCMNEILLKININSITDFEDKEKVEIFKRDF